MITRFLFSIIMLGMSVSSLYGQSKEEVYIVNYPSLYWGRYQVSFIIINNDSVISVGFDVYFSWRKKIIKEIKKWQPHFNDKSVEKMEDGNILVKYQQHTGTQIYYSTENFRKIDGYKFFKERLPELLSLNSNYELLKYLDGNFTKYYGEKEYRDVPLLKKRE